MDPSAYSSELAGVIAALTVLDGLVRRFNITTGSITIELDDESALNQSCRIQPLSVDHRLFEYLQENSELDQILSTYVKIFDS